MLYYRQIYFTLHYEYKDHNINDCTRRSCRRESEGELEQAELSPLLDRLTKNGKRESRNAQRNLTIKSDTLTRLKAGLASSSVSGVPKRVQA